MVSRRWTGDVFRDNVDNLCSVRTDCFDDPFVNIRNISCLAEEFPCGRACQLCDHTRRRSDNLHNKHIE